MDYKDKYLKYKKKYLELQNQLGGFTRMKGGMNPPSSEPQNCNDYITTLICNHYKFKSDEEYMKRLIEYNKNGYMQYKLSDKMNNEWKKCNKINNTLITKYVDELKEHILTPLKNIDTKYYFMSIVVMFRYEDDYIEEWLHYYIMQGAEHFFMYSNHNTLKTLQILQPFIDKGYVTLIEWDNSVINNISESKRRKRWNDYSKYSTQNLAFMDFVKNHKHKTKWIIKVDIDEFIYSKDTELKIKDILNCTSKKYYAVPRINFGNNCHDKKPKGLIIENYTKSELNPSSRKPIALTEFISNDDQGGAHNFKMK